MQDEKRQAGVRVREQGSGVVERKRVTGANDVATYVRIPKATVDQLIALCETAGETASAIRELLLSSTRAQ